MRLVEIQQNEVGVHAEFNDAALSASALRSCAADCRHHQRSLRRKRLRVAGLALGHERSGLDLFKQIEIVVGCDRVRAEADVHPGSYHAEHVRAARGQLQIADRAVCRGYMALGQQLHILLRHMDAVRRDRGHVEHMMAVEYLRGRQTVFLHARVVFLFCLGQVHL